MEGTLVIQEERKTIDKFRDWYQQKIIDTEVSQKFEKIIESRAQTGKKINEFAEKVLPSIVAKIPQAAFLAPLIPALARIGNFEAELQKNIILKSKRYIENVFIGVDGSCSEVSLPTINFDGLDKDIDTVVNGISSGSTYENQIADEQEYIEGYGMKR